MARTILQMQDTTTYTVELRFEVVGASQLESMSDDVMDVLDEHTSDAVLGAAASVSFAPPVLEVDVAVKATSPADLNRIMSEVLQQLDQHAGLRGLADATYAQSSRPAAALTR
jgi:hypothetical protein